MTEKMKSHFEYCCRCSSTHTWFGLADESPGCTSIIITTREAWIRGYLECAIETTDSGEYEESAGSFASRCLRNWYREFPELKPEVKS